MDTFITNGIQVTVSGSLSGLMVEDDAYDPNYETANYLTPYYHKQGDIRCMVKCRSCNHYDKSIKACDLNPRKRCSINWIFCDSHDLRPEIKDILKLKPEKLPYRGGWIDESFLPRV